MDGYAIGFGLLVAAVLLAAMVSDDHVRQKLSLVMLGAWGTSNLAVASLGFQHAMLVIPYLDLAAAIVVAVTGYTSRSASALVVFLIYGAALFTHVAMFTLHEQGTFTHYTLTGYMFLAQLLTVGASSAWLAVRRWSDRSRERLRPFHARRPDLA